MRSSKKLKKNFRKRRLSLRETGMDEEKVGRLELLFRKLKDDGSHSSTQTETYIPVCSRDFSLSPRISWLWLEKSQFMKLLCGEKFCHYSSKPIYGLSSESMLKHKQGSSYSRKNRFRSGKKTVGYSTLKSSGKLSKEDLESARWL